MTSVFTLGEDVYLNTENGRLCKIFTPPIDVAGRQFWWIQYVDGDRDMTIVHFKKLKKLKYGNVLFMEIL